MFFVHAFLNDYGERKRDKNLESVRSNEVSVQNTESIMIHVSIFTTNEIMCCRKQHRAYITPYLDLVDLSRFAVKLKTSTEKMILDFLS